MSRGSFLDFMMYFQNALPLPPSLAIAACAGSFLAGLANGGGAAREDNTSSEIRAAISIIMGGFLAVWTRSVCCIQQ